MAPPWSDDGWTIRRVLWIAEIIAQAHGSPDGQNVRIERAHIPISSVDLQQRSSEEEDKNGSSSSSEEEAR